MASLGFVTTYASSEFREDFAETIANFIVKTDDEWNYILDLASRGWASGDEDDVTSEFFCYFYYPNNDATQDIKYARENEVIEIPDEEGVLHKYLKKDRTTLIYDVEDKDGIDGVAAILQKVQIAREWFRTAWNVDLDALRQEVQDRQKSYNIDDLRKKYGL